MFKEKIVNKVLMIISTICIIFAIMIIIFSVTNNTYTELYTTSSKQIKTNYASTETHTWDISATENDNVTATLNTNGDLVISGKGKMKEWNGSAMTPWNAIGNLLINVKIQEGVTNIGDYAFYYRPNLTNVTISSTVTSIGDNSLANCKSLKNIEVDKNNKNYCAESGVLYTKDKTKIIRYPEAKTQTTYTILSSVKSIGNSAFFGANKLKTVKIPSSVTTIGDRAFMNCNSLANLEIPEKTTLIGKSAFFKCWGLKQIQIPNSVKKIDEFAFYDCTELSTILIPKEVTTIEKGVFQNCNKVTIICNSKSQARTYASENKIGFIIDDKAPEVISQTLSNTKPEKEIVVDIKVKDVTAEVKEGSLKYLLSTASEDITKKQIKNNLKSEDKIEIKDVTGTYYLWIYVVDNLGNENIVKKGPFKLDNKSPKLTLNSTATENTIKIEAKAKDEGFEIDKSSYKYYIKEENGTYGAAKKGETSYTFKNLKSKTKYIVKVEVADEAGNVVNKELEVMTLGTNKIETTKYKINEEKSIIKGITPKTTASEIKANLECQNGYDILDLEGRTVSNSTKIGTGYKVKTPDGKEYTIIIWGDFTGDGEISVSELAAASKLVAGIGETDSRKQMIIDVSMNGNIDIVDLAALSRLATE